MMPAATPAYFQWPVRVYIEDTDAGGIVYYINYLKYIERARTEYLRSLGFDKQFIFNADLMFVVHSVNSHYLKPARLDDELLATASVTSMGKAYMLLEQKVYRSAKDEGSMELLFQAEVKLACVDPETVKPKRIPAELASHFSLK